jgi:hypothetical protein
VVVICELFQGFIDQRVQSIEESRIPKEKSLSMKISPSLFIRRDVNYISNSR